MRNSVIRGCPGWISSCLLLLFVHSGMAAAQERTITGRISEVDTDRGLPGQVLLKGTAVGAVADNSGRFSLRVPEGPVTLVVEMIGYKPLEVEVAAGQNQLDINMTIDVLGLDELVVSGRATGVSRRNLANAVATVSGTELTRVAASSIEQQLAGKIAGADIQSNSGAPGGGLQVQLRGVSTIIGAHTPLYVIDGVIISDDVIPSGVFEVTVSSSNPVRGGSQDNSPNRIADLNPNDIETIEVLKGASAAAIYGSKASNGVIIITTKRGAGGETQYNLRQRVGVSKISNTIGMRRFETVDDAIAAFGEEAADYWEPGKFIDHEQIIAGNTPLLYETSASASGAIGNTRFFLSGLNLREGGIVDNTGYDKQSVRVNLSQTIGDRLTFDVNTNAVHSLTSRGITNNDNRSISYWMTFPYTPSFVDLRPDANGLYPDNPFSQSNPLETAALTTNDEEVWRFTGGVNATYAALRSDRHSVRLLGVAGYDFFNQKNELLTPAELQFEPLDGLPGTSVGASAFNQNINLGLNAVHDYSFGASSTATTSFGAQYESRDLDFHRVSARGLIAGQANLNRGTSVAVYQNRERVVDFGFFVQEEVLLGDRLLLTAGVRADRSSTNSDTDKFHYYPKAAASYRFIDLIPGFMDEMKVRAAYGESGNRPVYGQKFTQYVGQNIDGLPSLSVGNVTAANDLRPERQREIEGGLDFVLFDERATVQLTGYRKNVRDVLLERELPTSTGFTQAVFNGGKIRISGFEAAVDAVPVLTESFRWSTRANLSLDRNKITELTVPPFVTGGFGFLFGAFYAEEGGSLTAIWGNQTRADGSVTTARLGDSNPDFRVGFSNTLNYKDFQVYGLLDWQKGGMVINLTQLLYDLASNTVDCNDIVDGQSACARRVALWPRQTSVYLYDASFVKLRELTLSYQIPETFLNRIIGGARSAQISLSGRNLLTFTDYPGMDPEVSNFGSQAIERNVDVAPYPPSRSYWLSVDLAF